MSEEFSFVEVLMISYHPGDKEYQKFFEKAYTSSHEPDLLFVKSITAFQFHYFGQSLDRNYSSGIAWEVQSMDADFVFGDWLDELKKIGQSILSDKKEMGHPQASNTIRFVTLWSYSTFKDSYSGEFDSEWELVGLVEPKKVALMLKENVKSRFLKHASAKNESRTNSKS